MTSNFFWLLICAILGAAIGYFGFGQLMLGVIIGVTIGLMIRIAAEFDIDD